MGASARTGRRTEFDLSRTVAEIERIYTGLAGGAPASEFNPQD